MIILILHALTGHNIMMKIAPYLPGGLYMNEKIPIRKEDISSPDPMILGKEFYFLLNEEDEIYDELFTEERKQRDKQQ